MSNHREVLSKLVADNKLDPKISLFHINTYKHGDIYLDHVHENEIELMYVFCGYIYIQVNGCYIKIQKNECLITFPNTVHNLIPKKNEKCRAACIVFNPGNLSNSLSDFDLKDNFSFLYQILKNQLGYFKIIANLLIHNVIDAMSLYNSQKNEFSPELLKLYFCELYIYLSKELNENLKKQTLTSNQYVFKAIQYIANNYENAISVQDVAQHVNISDRHLIRLFNNELNMSVHEYITFIRIEKAKKLLSETDQNVTVIGIDLGFNSPQHFATIFKKYENTTPSNYRKQLRKAGNK